MLITRAAWLSLSAAVILSQAGWSQTTDTTSQAPAAGGTATKSSGASKGLGLRRHRPLRTAIRKKLAGKKGGGSAASAPAAAAPSTTSAPATK